MGDRRRRGAAGVVVSSVLALGLVAPAPSTARTLVAPDAGAPLPAAVRRLLQQGGPDTSNIMLAQLVRPRYKGYGWTIVAFKETPSSRTQLTFSFFKRAAEGTQSQTSTFGWTLPKGALRMDRDVKPASLVTGRGMGVNGRISMRMRGPSQFARARNPTGCTGTIAYRDATFRGTFLFDARDQYFGTVRFPSTRVLLYRAHNLECDPAEGSHPEENPCPNDLWLSAVDEESGIAVGAFKTTEGRVDQRVLAVGRSGRARTSHRISVNVAVPEAFEASDDLTSASVDGDIAGPWLSGDLEYLAPPPPVPGEDPQCGPYQSSSGLATGDYTAHFDSIGPISPASAGMQATLRREAP